MTNARRIHTKASITWGIFPVFTLPLVFAVTGLWSKEAWAATYTAASCNASDLQAAINKELATPADGDVISIPAGTCTWTGTTPVSGSFDTSVTIQGAGAISATTGGASTTGSDQTVIMDDINSYAALDIGVNAGKSFRLTGLAVMENASSTPHSLGMVNIAGSSRGVRVDHCHFYMVLSAYDMFLNGVRGVVDHVFFDSTGANGGVKFVDGDGNQSWATAEQWGSSNFMFVEDSRYNRHGLGDSHAGARYVLRHNTFTSPESPAPYMANHAITPDGRSMKEAEVYQNTFTNTVQFGAGQPTYAVNGGTLLYWGNTISGYQFVVDIDYTRKDNTEGGGGNGYAYGTPPTGWGFCSTIGGNGWDGRAVAPSGYPCLDQPGRGAGDLVSGSPPTACNQTLGCTTDNGQWPRQALSPLYIWGNTFTPATGYGQVGLVAESSTCATCSTSLVLDNRDYYQQFGTNGESGSFNGTKGIGQGLLSARPSTCTAGPGGNTPGVGYWATDTNTLYVCNPTNTWVVYYTPYTYPHPLTQGASGAPPAPPTNLTATVH